MTVSVSHCLDVLSTKAIPTPAAKAGFLLALVIADARPSLVAPLLKEIGVRDNNDPTGEIATDMRRIADQLFAEIEAPVGAHDDLVGVLRDIARRAEDETLGIQAARLTAIANQAHAAIRDSEAPA